MPPGPPAWVAMPVAGTVPIPVSARRPSAVTKLGARNRVDAARIANEAGWL
jgi:hypothetical protein